ncbi:MAG: GTPase HflX [Sphingobacteriia bacterium]|nr:GTPase HflX [Sphingobacteriia bacterium]
MAKTDSVFEQIEKTNCLIILPVIKGTIKPDLVLFKLEEAEGLATTLELNVVDKFIIYTKEFKPSTLITSGKIEEIKPLIAHFKVGLVYIDMPLTPVQQRNLERALNAKVIDRTGIILEIFASRARTKEGKLQVRLAQLDYQKSRLVRLWTHLERQRGGLGKTGGPGETQLELDKRMIRDEMAKIKKHLEKVRVTRDLHRKNRDATPYPIVALVGYTNAGKSTLFNLLSGAGVLAEDKLFATLDPTMRLIKLPSRKTVILSDTVGFIADLPTELIAAFRATLEEVAESTIILHVKDSSSPMCEKQERDVAEVMRSLGLVEKWKNNTIHVYNKVDKLDSTDDLPEDAIKISALKKQGINELLQKIDEKLMENDVKLSISLHVKESDKISWLYKHASILSVENIEDSITFEVSIDEANLMKWNAINSDHIKTLH